jgi:uncharacterized protein (TIGR00369 family)
MTDRPDGFEPLTLQSAFVHTMDMKLCQTFRDGRRVMGVRVEPQHCNMGGAAHGGFLLALADLALSYGTYAPDDYPPRITLNLSTDFITAVRGGDWLELEVDVKRSGRSLAFVDGVGRVGDEVVMRMSGLFRPVLEPMPAAALQSGGQP